ncbi:MAG: IS5 family transposase [Rhodobacterales bacterium]|uniref:IS5 family transposase n=1 Tax=Puniceibacterium antarcticum TaxID=1206336 RepID=UPI0026C5C269
MNEQRLEPHLPGKVNDAGATAKNNRLFLEAIFWRVRTGSSWRDLPPAFGHCNNQFRRWARSGVFKSLFKAISGDPDLEYALIPSRQIAAQSPAGQWRVPSFRFTRRQPAQRGKAQTQAIGRSRGGLMTKIVALVEALGNLVRCLLLPRQAHDMKGVAQLIRGVSFDVLLAPSRDISCGNTLPGNGQGVRCGLADARPQPPRCNCRDPAQSQPQHPA